MQNFTLRFKGKMFYLLALTILIGSLPSVYGQACPTVDDSTQEFCNALSTVADLQADGDVDWYDEPGSTDPLPMNEILRDGEDYYAGSPDCTGTRQSVTVTITGPATPVVQDDFFTPCADGATYTIADLKEAIDAEAAPSGYTLEIFSTRYTKDETPLADGTTLTVGNYYAGYYDADTGCQSMRKPVRYEPVEANAPTADGSQTVCEGTTVSELEAQGTNLWYRTATSEPALADDFEVQDGETYYASQVVPADGPPCESDERTPVTVTVLPADAGPDNTDNVLCVSEADSQLNNVTNARAYFLSLLENNNDGDTANDVPTDGTFSPDIASIVADYNDGTKTGDYQTTYTATFDGECEDSVVLGVSVKEDPYAGEDTTLDVCISDLESFLPLNSALAPAAEAYILNYFDSSTTIDTPGTFSPSITDLFAQINEDNENNAFPQTYPITYTVDNEGCTNSATLTLTIQSTNDAGEDASETQCETDVDDSGIFASEAALRAYYVELLGAEDTDGSFSPGLATLISNYNNGITAPSEDFTTTYTVDGSTECDPASATATLTVNASIPADAGTGTGDTYCSNENTDVDLYTLLSGDYGTGTFSSSTADVADATFNPAEEGAGTYEVTYTVSPDTDCVTGTASTTFTLTVNQAPNAGPGGEFSFCKGEFDAIIANPVTAGQELLNELGGSDIDLGGTFASDDLATLLGTYNSTTELPVTFTTTYTVNNDDCADSATYSITINPNTEVSAGGDQEVTFCTTDGSQDLTASLGDGATSGGTFSSDDADVTGGMFDPSVGVGEYTITYSVDAGDNVCLNGEDSSTITVTVIEGVDAGSDVTEVVCVNDIDENFFTEDALNSYYLGLLADGVATDGTFDPSIASLVDDYNNGKTTGDFTTTYTVSNGTCEASVQLTLTIRENVDADLTEVDDVTLCQNAGVQDLTDFIGDNPDLGVFTYDGDAIDTFNPGEMGAGDYVITYSLDEATTPCVSGSDSITFTITVEESAYAGMDMEFDVCQNDGVQDLFEVLSDATDSTGEFTLDGDVITDGMMDPSEFAAGTYEVTYSVPSENDCGPDSATFMITVNESPDAGVGGTAEVCQNADVVDLFGLLAEGNDMSGTFSLDGSTITDGMMDPSDFDPDTYDVTYTVMNDDETCSDSATFSITVKDAANAGDDMEFDVCMNAGTQDLFGFLSADADTDGEFTLEGDVVADGMMDPATFAAGTYTVTYTVSAINDCGDDTASFEITVQESPDAPEVNDISFCAIQFPTGADLMMEGEDLTFYSDETLETMVLADDDLVSGTYYVTQRTSEDGCESDATAFTVTINDPGTPTIDNTSLSFCQYDDATVADLSDAVDQTSNVTWYASADGTEPLNTGTALQSGKYYATLYDVDTDCESSQRLEVTVTIEDCPLLFPEGISPNGDGKNDTFDIENIEREYPNYTIQIYNRWGDVVYKGDVNTPDWDGTANQSGALGDDVLPVGVYFYLLDFNDGSTEPKRGKIYLSR